MANKTIREYLEYIRTQIPEADYKNISGNKLFDILRLRKTFIEVDGFNNVPNDLVQQHGLFTGKWNYQPLVTEKGVKWLTNGLVEKKYITILDKPKDYNECTFNWIIKNISNEKYLIEYKKSNGVWYTLSYKYSKLNTLIKIIKNSSECRYSLKKST
ncbi:MAG TPA: hypothetical protein VIM70_09835 [Clostridium sp.]|uniref:hypothetical protein n=1 Tax=Clostridium sp. TaxID=1506 RepID=UPI002F9423A4